MRWPVDGDDTEGYPYGSNAYDLDREDPVNFDDTPSKPIKSWTRLEQIKHQIRSHKFDLINHRESLNRYLTVWLPRAEKDLANTKAATLAAKERVEQSEMWIADLNRELGNLE